MYYPGAGYPGFYYQQFAVSVVLEVFSFDVLLHRIETGETTVVRSQDSTSSILSDSLTFSVEVDR